MELEGGLLTPYRQNSTDWFDKSSCRLKYIIVTVLILSYITYVYEFTKDRLTNLKLTYEGYIYSSSLPIFIYSYPYSSILGKLFIKLNC